MKLIAHKFVGVFLESVYIDYVLVLPESGNTSREYAKQKLVNSFSNHMKKCIIIKDTIYPLITINENMMIKIMSEYIGIGVIEHIKNIVSSDNIHIDNNEDELTSFKFMTYDRIIKEVNDKGILIV